MKIPILLVILISLMRVPIAAQHPLVGTWEMISVKGINADGEAFFLDTTSVRETKIISPTHYMLIAWDADGDSLIFNRTMAGQFRLDGEKYIETPTHASVQIFDDVRVGFTWKLEGNVFTQSGTLVRPDGKKVVLEALVFRRVTDVKPHNENPAIGTWSQLSGYYSTPDGKSNPFFNKSDTRLLIVTPTHWMRMDHKNKKFEGVLYGTYMMEGDSILTKLDYSSYPFKKGHELGLRQKVKGKNLEIKSTGETPDGKPATLNDLYEKQ